MHSQEKLLFIGSVMVDIICPIPSLPQPGAGVVSEEFEMAAGGCAYNAARIAHQLGANCQLFAPLGVGPYASFAKAQIEESGLSAFQADTSLDCGAALCLVTADGERTMITLPGVERKFESEWFKSLQADDCSYGYVCGYELGGTGGDAIIEFLKRNSQIQTVFAPGPTICKIDTKKMKAMNKLNAIWHLNEVEAISFTGKDDVIDAGISLAQACKNIVIITEGSKGAHLFQPHSGNTEEITGSTQFSDSGQLSNHAQFNNPDQLSNPTQLNSPAQPSTVGVSHTEVSHTLIPTKAIKPFDTIGAGDNHIGALLAAKSVGKSWEEAIALANKISAAVCLTKGATLSQEEFDELGISLK